MRLSPEISICRGRRRPPFREDNTETRQRPSDPGRAYLVFTSANPYWYRTALNSFANAFPKARSCLVNMDLPPEVPSWLERFRPDPQDKRQVQGNLVHKPKKKSGSTCVHRREAGL
jgi:hypothetical protein